MKSLLLLVALIGAVCCAASVEENEFSEHNFGHKMSRRSINSAVPVGESSSLADRTRARRSAEDCEKLQLCKLHARSQRNFFAAFELYFVNKENARLWDHQAHTVGDCYRRYSCYR
ncbi:uncharacterized protein LOC121730461 [Aricia agestis]|uniref:uncharacterized protein LOC121730461 n=1 Tax=Aricia agestis TaxID=91739 RepID=UPI001C2052C0|nr:uncharacterized protein LOC121730461 [Aricia agestis]